MSQTSFTGIAASGDGVSIIVTAGTGTVTVEFETAPNTWALRKTYSADAAEVFKPQGIKFRVLRTGNATFTLGNVIGAV